MFCAQCGTQLPEGAGFCPSCGAKSAAGPGAGAGRRRPTMLITLTTVLLAAVIAAALLLVWRSGGDGRDEIAGVRPVVVSSEPVPLPPGPTCVLPSSFQFVSEWQLEAPDLRALVGDDGLATEILGPALDDVSVSGRADGTFRAPGSVRMEVDMEEVKLDLALLPGWMDVQVPGTGERYEGGAGEDEVMFGQEICSDLVEGIRSLNAQATREEIRGISALHVQLDERAMSDLAALLENTGVYDRWIAWDGSDTQDGGRNLLEFAMLPTELSLSLWLAQDGLWPVRIEADGGWQAEGFGEIRLQLSYQWKPDDAPAHD